MDEVLAVGDAQFQKRCLGKMREVSKGGRTVIFVSHNMDAVVRLCGVSILLEQGAMIHTGHPRDVVARYLRGGSASPSHREWSRGDRPGNDVVRLNSVQVTNSSGDLAEECDIRHDVTISLKYEVLNNTVPLVGNINLFDEQGNFIFVTHDVNTPLYNKPRPIGEHTTSVVIPGNFLADGAYSVTAGFISLFPFKAHAHAEQAVWFRVFNRTRRLRAGVACGRISWCC